MSSTVKSRRKTYPIQEPTQQPLKLRYFHGTHYLSTYYMMEIVSAIFSIYIYPFFFFEMNFFSSVAKRYRLLLVASLLSSEIFIPLLPAFADQNSPAPNLIENQATASFVDSADNSTQTILSNKVQVVVAEVAGISATNAGITNTVYRTNVVFFDFLVRNEGNDPSQIFVPAAPSRATIGKAALPASSIGQLQVIEYNNLTETKSITSNNLVNTTSGSATSSLTGVPNAGSVPAGGYIKVRVPITVPPDAKIGELISVTLGNTADQPQNTNTPYVQGANGTGTNDLYTQDNADGTTGEFNGIPVNGDTPNHRQEASAVQTIAVVAPPNIKISGTVWNDANNSANNTFTNIQNNSELGANITPAVNAILVDSAGNVVATTLVTSNGTYTFNDISGAQKGLYIILSTTTGVVGTKAPDPGLPVGWSNTSPLTYVAVPFDIVITDVTNKDFGATATSTGISGTIFHDRDNSAQNTFTNIKTNNEVGTDGVFGTSTKPLYVTLVDITTGLVLNSQLVAANGTYAFTNIPSNTNVKVIISTTAGSIGLKPPDANVPNGWVGTSPPDSGTFNTGISVTNRDFGIRQKAKFVLYKLITKINGQTTSPDGKKDLTTTNIDNFNIDTFSLEKVGNWPSGYLVGQTDAGTVRPGDTIEYTVYFMNNQGADATKIKICDPIRGGQEYVPNSIKLRMGNASLDTDLTDLADGVDRANFYGKGNTPTDCNAGAITSSAADQGGVVIGITGDSTTNQPVLGGLPGATGVATPSTYYGLFRFTTKVQK
jgi:uncharacterized repeat protein (TIGR01451 family)